MRILVCGGRKFGWLEPSLSDEEKDKRTKEMKFLCDCLDAYLDTYGKDLYIIQGEAPGADSLAKAWAVINDVEHSTEFAAEWDRYDKSAGFVRNVRMIEEGNPDLVVAFPGGTGTANMINIAQQANLPIDLYKKR